ncbi:RNA-binding protein [Fulvimarina endophytica]|uniref:RNA-binding protein n=1 Tax=Fulvimarina endophytica TaxID=2293836 RepID=A0A371X113_9HYPH|nr:RNA-binding protein [Fulvimarina endophytica]RFC62921.1 RNA-binding protein [Fulvimarina endophytica]
MVADREQVTREPEDEEELVLNDRTCIVSRDTMEPDRLIRFVRAPDGSVVPDLRRRLPGRGAHVVCERAAVDEAMRRKLFARAFRAPVTGPADLGADLDRLLAKSALGALGIAKKAGQLVTGTAKVEAAARSGQAIFVLHAREASEDGRRKVTGARYAGADGVMEDAIPAASPFFGEELDLALGGGNVIHAAILYGDAGSAAERRLVALLTYRGEWPGAGDTDLRTDTQGEVQR